MNTPTLRFKEFSGAWEVKKLGDVATFFDSKRIPLSESERQLKQGKFPYYGASGIIDYVDEYIFDGEFVLLGEDGANIITRNSKLAFVIKGKFWVNNHAHIMQAKESNLFLAESLERIKYEQYNTGTVQPKLNVESCKNIAFHIPTLPEQTKIANFLTAIDEKIAQLSQTAQLLTDYKKGVMQQIFSQQLRFKDDDGREFAEWDFIELEKVAFKVNAKNKDCSITNVLTNSATQGIVNQADYFDRDIANQNNLGGYYVVEIDDFVYNPRISNHALVGSLKRNNLVKGVMSPLYTVFRFKNGSLPFFEQYFETTHWHDYMKSVANSGARHDRLNITNDDFLNLPVPFPSLPEQTKIANFLTAIDDKINNNQTQRDAMKQYKAGLLQQMFV